MSSITGSATTDSEDLGNCNFSGLQFPVMIIITLPNIGEAAVCQRFTYNISINPLNNLMRRELTLFHTSVMRKLKLGEVITSHKKVPRYQAGCLQSPDVRIRAHQPTCDVSGRWRGVGSSETEKPVYCKQELLTHPSS